MNCRLIHEVVGAPFVVSLPRSIATYATLARTMECYARHSVDIFQPPVSACSRRNNTTSRRRAGSTSSNESSAEDDNMEVSLLATAEGEMC